VRSTRSGNYGVPGDKRLMYRYIAVDCSSLLFGNAFKMKQLKANEVKTGAIFGFLRNLLFLAQYFHCNKFLFCWDGKGSDRKKIFPEYKNKRGKSRKEDKQLEDIYQAVLVQSRQLKNEILPQCGFNNHFAQEGKEADDLLANIVTYHDGVLMVSNDEDMFQMLDLCDIWNNGKQRMWSERSFIKEYGITPIQWVDVKALGGCSSDDIPGIPGVAEKTAIKYLLGNLPVHHKTFTAIKNGKDIIERNYKLVRLPMDGTKYQKIIPDTLNYDAFEKMCKKYWFNSFLENLSMDWENFFRGRV